MADGKLQKIVKYGVTGTEGILGGIIGLKIGYPILKCVNGVLGECCSIQEKFGEYGQAGLEYGVDIALAVGAAVSLGCLIDRTGKYIDKKFECENE